MTDTGQLLVFCKECGSSDIECDNGRFCNKRSAFRCRRCGRSDIEVFHGIEENYTPMLEWSGGLVSGRYTIGKHCFQVQEENGENGLSVWHSGEYRFIPLGDEAAAVKMALMAAFENGEESVMRKFRAMLQVDECAAPRKQESKSMDMHCLEL
jgi:hypothetical protein